METTPNLTLVAPIKRSSKKYYIVAFIAGAVAGVLLSTQTEEDSNETTNR